jgi:hypothetical protein
MIGRLWRGQCSALKADAYEQHLRQTTLPDLSDIDGYRGAYVLRRQNGGRVEFVVLTLWNSLDAVRVFAGDQHVKAVVPPDAAMLLTSFDEEAAHYEIVVYSTDPGN